MRRQLAAFEFVRLVLSLMVALTTTDGIRSCNITNLTPPISGWEIVCPFIMRVCFIFII